MSHPNRVANCKTAAKLKREGTPLSHSQRCALARGVRAAQLRKVKQRKDDRAYADEIGSTARRRRKRGQTGAPQYITTATADRWKAEGRPNPRNAIRVVS